MGEESGREFGRGLGGDLDGGLGGSLWARRAGGSELCVSLRNRIRLNIPCKVSVMRLSPSSAG